MKVEEYREDLHVTIATAAKASNKNPTDEFLEHFVKILSDSEEFDDYYLLDYEGENKRGGSMKIDGYAMDDTDGSCCVFIAVYRGPYEKNTIVKKDIDDSFNKIKRFVKEATETELYKDLEECSQEYDFAKELHDDLGKITKFRFFLLTDAYNNQQKKNIQDESIAGKIVELNVWDVTRIFNIVNSKTQKESIEINFRDWGVTGIPCVKAVEYNDVIADIDIAPKFDEETGHDEKPENIITYSSYLAVISGQILNDLYLEYGSRLLEGNVRSFLSVRGNVNKNIQNTIKNYPEMFFAYNNGIAATATEVQTDITKHGMEIVRIKNLQIVNGGQTTASIANALLTKKKGETVNISNLYVPMKISVLEHSMAERIIPKISEYSNSQNKVDASDFFSNHPFHIRMEGYSIKIPAPAVHGNQYQQYWYYERARGQYNQSKMKFKPKSKELNQHLIKYPENQVIKLVDLAKYMEIYEGVPHIVSKGKQEVVKRFSENIKKLWAKSDSEFNTYYYKRVVALAIMFKRTNEIIMQKDWYKQKHSYKANVIAYTMSIIFDYIRKKQIGLELDFIRIWNLQELYNELDSQINVLCTEVYYFITREDRLQENVTQWCKNPLCWERAQKETWTITEPFLKTLISSEKAKSEQKKAKENADLNNKVDALKYIMAMKKSYWEKMLAWGLNRGLLTEREQSVLKLIINMDYTGRLPSDKQAGMAIKARERLINEGMPMQF